MAQDLSQFVNKKAVVQHNVTADDGTVSLEEVEGTVLAGNEMGILIKPKGKTQAVLIERANIEGEVSYVAEKPKPLTQRKIRDISFGGARQHLVASHGYKVSEINGMAEDKAFEFHNSLDHSDLGHKHEAAKPSTDQSAGENDEADDESAA